MAPAGKQTVYQMPVFRPEATALKFINCTDEKKFIMGPFGGGKSSACCYHLFISAFAQAPASDGVRYTRHAIVRGTYSDLVNSSMRTWVQWVPERIGEDGNWKDLCPITRPMNGSPTGHMRIPWVDFHTGKPDGTMVDMEVVFLSCDDPRDIGKLRSNDYTILWFNELSMFKDQTVFNEATARLGRFPSGRYGQCTYGALIGDTNAPDTDHWFYKLSEVDKPQGFTFFKQPPAVVEEVGDTAKPGEVEAGECVVQKYENDTYTYRINPECENVKTWAKGKRYWLDQIPGKTRGYIGVYLMNRYGSVEYDRPVFPRYSDERHCAKKPLEVNKSLPLVLGLDFGGTPAVAFMQMTTMGQLRIVDEITTGYKGATLEDRTNLRHLIQSYIKPRMFNKYGNMKYVILGDPIGGNQRGQTDGVTCNQVLYEEFGHYEDVPEYGWEARIDAVNYFLSRNIDKGEPAFLISPTCEVIRRAFLGRYSYPKSNSSGEEKVWPNKHTIYSHIMDAVMGASVYIMGNGAPRRNAFGHDSQQKETQVEGVDFLPII